MSYLVLARRCRPQRFDSIVGQPHVAKTLLNGLRQGRIAHAYLFSGPRGVGKTTTARLVAKALNCLNTDNGEPCGKCNSCKGINDGRFIDVIEIDAASNTGVDDIRKLRDGIRYAPIEGKAKVYIIDEVHMLSQGAFNALLKTLEEPPDHAYFCLATTEVQKLPATIISRCQRFDLRRISVSELRDNLQKICENDNMEFDIEALDIIARRADGSVRDSLSLLDQVIAYTGGKILKQDTIEAVGEVRLDQYYKAVSLIKSHSLADAFRLDEELAFKGADPQDYLLGLQGYLIQLLQAKSLGIENVDIPSEAKDDFAEALDQFSDGDLMRLLQLATTAETDVRRNYSPRVRIQLLFLRFAAFERSVVLADIINNVISKEPTKLRSTATATAAAPQPGSRVQTNSSNTQTNLTASTTAPRPQAESIAKDSERSVSPQAGSNTSSTPPASAESSASIPDNPLLTVQEAWSTVCDGVARKHNSRGRMIQYGGFPVQYNNGRLKINFSSSTHLDTAKSCQQTLVEELTKIIGPVTVDLQIGDLPDSNSNASNPEEDPTVKMLIDRLGARPVD